MGTREVYEEKLRRGNLYDHDPTIIPGLGTPRCPRCFTHLVSNPKTSEWAITPVLYTSTAMAGAGIGTLLGYNHAWNTGLPFLIFKVLKLPAYGWLTFSISMSALFVSSASCAAFGAFALPGLTQLSVTSYYAASRASHYGVSLLTRRIEEAHTSTSQQKKL